MRPWMWLGVTWRQLIFGFSLVALVHQTCQQYIDLPSGCGDIPSRCSALTTWLRRRTSGKTGEGVPLFRAGVWTLARNGVWWADLKRYALFGPLLLSSIVADMPTCGGFPHLPSAWLTQHWLSVLLESQSHTITS